jgi:hypothetical protein
MRMHVVQMWLQWNPLGVLYVLRSIPLKGCYLTELPVVLIVGK